MEEPKAVEKSDEAKAPEPVKVKNKSKNKILWVVLAILLLGGVVGFEVWRGMGAKKEADNNKASITALEKRVSELQKQLEECQNKNNSATSATSTCKDPTDFAKENIIASITSKNTAALESFMATSVKVTIAASEYSKDRTKTEAVKDIDYVVNAQEPWNFALSTATLDTYKAGSYKDYFKSNSIVGVAKDKKVIVFNFDCGGKISGVFMAASSELLAE